MQYFLVLGMQGYYYEDDEYEEMLRRHSLFGGSMKIRLPWLFGPTSNLLVKLPFLRSLPFYRNLYGWKK